MNQNALSFYDTSGTLQSQLGELPDGTYGMAQLARQGIVNGDLVDIGLLCSPVVLVGETFTKTDSDYSGGPSGSVNVGSSGSVLVTATCGVYVSETDCTGAMGLYVDGTNVWDGILYVENNSGGGVGGNQSNAYVVTGLSAADNPHTFALKGKSSLSGAEVSFDTPTLIVQPY